MFMDITPTSLFPSLLLLHSFPGTQFCFAVFKVSQIVLTENSCFLFVDLLTLKHNLQPCYPGQYQSKYN